jgi:hypothetical protein
MKRTLFISVQTEKILIGSIIHITFFLVKLVAFRKSIRSLLVEGKVVLIVGRYKLQTNSSDKYCSILLTGVIKMSLRSYGLTTKETR